VAYPAAQKMLGLCLLYGTTGKVEPWHRQLLFGSN
jgi:hypothetical protein